jgi:hypothetical protein
MASTSKRSAKVICSTGTVWVSPKQFWSWVRDGIVEYLSEPPLTGRLQGHPNKFIVSIEHTLLDMTCPEHLHSVLLASHRQKNRR